MLTELDQGSDGGGGREKGLSSVEGDSEITRKKAPCKSALGTKVPSCFPFHTV